MFVVDPSLKQSNVTGHLARVSKSNRFMDKDNLTTPGGETRRNFIRKTATAAAAVATTGLFKTPVYGQNQAPQLAA